MLSLTRWSARRAVLSVVAPGALLLQTGCPVDGQALIADQATQLVADTVFFVVEAALVRVF